MHLRASGWVFLLLATVAAAPALAAAGPLAPPAGLRIEQHLVHSAIMGRDYRLYVALPTAPPPAAGYRVIYLLDGNITFPMAMATLAKEEKTHRELTQEVVVGVGYDIDGEYDPARNYDLTPPVPGRTVDRDGEPIGGADKFLRAIETEMKPLIEKDAPIDHAHQTLFGHSYGGLFALHVLYSQPQDFSAYVAASPSLRFGDSILDKEEKSFSAGMLSERIGVLLMAAEYEQVLSPDEAGTPGASERAKKLAERRFVDRVRELAERLDRLPTVTARFHRNDGANHPSELPASVERALRFAAEPPKSGS
ncbi:alpha/beta hydrolase [Consotaella salsifontis]|uniref:Alpha/beta hydrolase n=1 Tax=Consotaella salsifontis TaxID=1365950 RepID=A0A1T4QP56_9HYPH|nr:alpha/beta hydrolase-fold protein [Consotaella salsifontis]SKA05539.1 hypothetical protein SAMN05428963_105167 [Consotaella salsifontis]